MIVMDRFTPATGGASGKVDDQGVARQAKSKQYLFFV
jgi:hypothetical protein